MKKGLVVGKFYPFHSGHAYLIETALKHSDQVVVLVVDRSTQVFPGEERANWIREIFPQVDVRVVLDIENDDDSKLWAEYTIDMLGYAPDTVFTSEDYGTAYAQFLGAKHFLVDKERTTIPISGTKVRENPYHVWEFLSKPVRASLARRIAILGAESTGTTTLARALAQHFHTVWVPEFGRFYSEGKTTSDTAWETEEFVHIAKTQSDLEDELARFADKLLICDTNAWATRLWHERYLGKLDPAVDAIANRRHYDLVILTGDEIPFEQDGLRDGEHIRHAMQGRFREVLESEGIPFVLLSGDREERLKKAIKLCENLIASGADIFSRFPRRTLRV